MPVFLDTYGPALEAIWGFWPSVIQLNRREAALHLHKPSASDGDVIGLLRNGPATESSAASSPMAPNPVLICHRGKPLRAIPPRITPGQPDRLGRLPARGTGRRLARAGIDPEPLFRRAVGCAVANAMVWDAGAIDPAEITQWRDQVIVEPATR